MVFMLVLAGCSDDADNQEKSQDSVSLKNADDKTSVTPNSPKEDQEQNKSALVRTFVLTGEKFRFYMDGIENPEIRVKQGERVRIELTSKDMMHDWVVDGVARTPIVAAPETTSVEFTADIAGTYEYYCSVGQHRARGMKGLFVVESK
ncbi:MAG: plastocyanin/azurin family copper-binding protein [Candidatus Woesearchaeota archaeon]